MTLAIADPQVQALAGIAGQIAPRYARTSDDPWNGSPFQWILGLPFRSRGAVGEALVAGWCAAQGLDVVRPRDSQADRIIAGYRVEVKFSTLWRSGVFKFQQIRDQDYDFCFCLGLSPFDAQAWLLPKSVLHQYVIGHMGQHTGAGGQDTAWLSFQADAPFEWMAPYGGRLADVRAILERLQGEGGRLPSDVLV